MFAIGPACTGELDTILALRAEASQWLAERGIDQWSRPWPSEQGQRERIAASIAAGETWMVRDGCTVAATIAVDRYADPRLWTRAERAEPARYVHRLIVARAYAGLGLGARLLDWVELAAAHAGDRWLRVDVWADNPRLQAYYQRLRFVPVRIVTSGDYPSGALLQRRVPAAR